MQYGYEPLSRRRFSFSFSLLSTIAQIMKHAEMFCGKNRIHKKLECNSIMRRRKGTRYRISRCVVGSVYLTKGSLHSTKRGIISELREMIIICDQVKLTAGDMTMLCNECCLGSSMQIIILELAGSKRQHVCILQHFEQILMFCNCYLSINTMHVICIPISCLVIFGSIFD